VDSKVVNRSIRDRVRPFLKAHGFAVFTSRSAWRYCGTRIEVVNFQSFNTYLAEVVGCTTFSFAINLGIYFLAIPARFPLPRNKDDGPMPAEYQCHFRRQLAKSISQTECPRPDIWFVAPDGVNLESVIDDALGSIARDGLAWFGRYSDLSEVLRVLLEEDGDKSDVGWGFGTRQSPNRDLYTGYIAHSLGYQELAVERLRKALAYDGFRSMSDRIEADLQLAVGRP
jgi:hypothetical protein